CLAPDLCRFPSPSLALPRVRLRASQRAGFALQCASRCPSPELETLRCAQRNRSRSSLPLERPVSRPHGCSVRSYLQRLLAPPSFALRQGLFFGERQQLDPYRPLLRPGRFCSPSSRLRFSL